MPVTGTSRRAATPTRAVTWPMLPATTPTTTLAPAPTLSIREYYTTVVGEFQNSPSPYGTFDQAGNVWEWNDALFPTYRVVCAGHPSTLARAICMPPTAIHPVLDVRLRRCRLSRGRCSRAR